MTHLLAGFLLGVAGSVHCLGMCGPLALIARRPASFARRPASFARRPLLTTVVPPDDRRPTYRPSSHLTTVVPSDERRPVGDGLRLPLPRNGGEGWGEAAPFLVYHASRIGVYLALGAAAGLTGGALAGFGWRSGLAIAAGVALVGHAAGLTSRLAGAWPGRTIAALTARLGAAARVLPREGLARSSVFGLLNGLLPCGLLYAALAAAAGLGSARDAIGFIAAFGCGSLPVFAALTYSARAFIPRTPGWLRQAAPLALALVGLLLIARGLPEAPAHDHRGQSNSLQSAADDPIAQR